MPSTNFLDKTSKFTKLNIRSWQTFSAGCLGVIGALTTLIYAIVGGALKDPVLGPSVIMGAATAVFTGLGVALSRQNNVSSVDVGIQGVGLSSQGNPVVVPIGPDSSDHAVQNLACVIRETEKAKVKNA